MTMNRITDESLNQLIAIESLASDNAGDDKRQADQIYHSDIVSALEELRDCRNSAAYDIQFAFDPAAPGTECTVIHEVRA